MATLAFDSLRYARRLKEVGVPQEQAEVQAELMADTFGFYVENLVTKEYLESRFAEQDARIDSRFAEMEQRFDEKLSLLRVKLGQHSLMHGATFTAVVIPLIRDLLV